MKSQLDRAIKLAANTGDKIIVVDELNNRSSVVMSLEDYEKLLNSQNKRNKGLKNLTDEELLDKINCDIVTWKDVKENKGFLAETVDSEDDFEDEKGDEIFPDFTAPNLTSDGDLTPEAKEEEAEEIKNEPVSAETAADNNENLYYYNEPEKAETAHEETGFTSIKDELKKSRKTWEIPEDVKEAAEDVIF